MSFKIMSSSVPLGISRQTARPQPPPEPCPWLWRCHQCHIIYRLATTRRCLECNHEFCLADPATSSSTARKRKRGGPCRAEFDYVGWAARGAWRRTILLNHDKSSRQNDENNKSRVDADADENDSAKARDLEPQEGGVLLSRRRWIPASAISSAWGDEHRALELGLGGLADRFAEKKEALLVRKRHNCWLHCDFPSECHHAVYRAQRAGEPVLGRARAVDETYIRIEARRAAINGNGAAVKGSTVPTASSSQDGSRVSGRSRAASAWAISQGYKVGNYEYEEHDGVDDEDEFANGMEVETSYCSSPRREDDVGNSSKQAKKRYLSAHDLDGDHSYETFKEHTANTATSDIETSTPMSSAPSSSLDFQIHVDDSSYPPPSTSPVSFAKADPNPVPAIGSPANNQDCSVEPRKDEEEDDVNTFLTSLYANAAQPRKYHARRASLANPVTHDLDDGTVHHAIPTSPDKTRTTVRSLHSFAAFETFSETENHDPSWDNQSSGNLSLLLTPVHNSNPEHTASLEEAYRSEQSWFPPSSDAEKDHPVPTTKIKVQQNKNTTKNNNKHNNKQKKCTARRHRLSRERMTTLLRQHPGFSTPEMSPAEELGESGASRSCSGRSHSDDDIPRVTTSSPFSPAAHASSYSTMFSAGSDANEIELDSVDHMLVEEDDSVVFTHHCSDSSHTTKDDTAESPSRAT